VASSEKSEHAVGSRAAMRGSGCGFVRLRDGQRRSQRAIFANKFLAGRNKKFLDHMLSGKGH
jgi:hypothetical protein